MITVYLDRLIETSGIDMSDDSDFEWDGHKVTIADVRKYLHTGQQGTNKPYGDTFKYLPTPQDKLYHIQRIAWFVQHLEEIQGISVDNRCDGWYILPNTIIDDGWHRILAAYIYGLAKVKINYGGRKDILNYLKGRRKTRPWNLWCGLSI